jgi:hypothetical protein
MTKAVTTIKYFQSFLSWKRSAAKVTKIRQGNSNHTARKMGLKIIRLPVWLLTIVKTIKTMLAMTVSVNRKKLRTNGSRSDVFKN